MNLTAEYKTSPYKTINNIEYFVNETPEGCKFFSTVRDGKQYLSPLYCPPGIDTCSDVLWNTFDIDGNPASFHEKITNMYNL